VTKGSRRVGAVWLTLFGAQFMHVCRGGNSEFGRERELAGQCYCLVLALERDVVEVVEMSSYNP